MIREDNLLDQMHGDLVRWNAFDTSYIPTAEALVYESDSDGE